MPMKSVPNIDIPQGERGSELHLFLLEGARWQDFLLQSYRTLHLTVQGILLAIGTGLVVTALALDRLSKVRAVTAVLFLIAAMSLALLVAMYRIVIARGKDVNFWHKRMIDFEQHLPPAQRYFTRFKINQKEERLQPKLVELFLGDQIPSGSESLASRLVDEQLGHTRRILDRGLFWGIVAAWVVLLLVGFQAAELF